MQPKEPQMSVLASSPAAGLPCPSGGSDHQAIHGHRPRKGAPPGPHAILPGPLLDTLYCPCDYARDHCHPLTHRRGWGGKAPAGSWLEAGFDQVDPSPAWIIPEALAACPP